MSGAADRPIPGVGDGFALAVDEERDLLASRPRARAVPSDRSDSSWSWALPGQGRPCGRPPHRAFRYRACPENHAVPYVDSCDRRDCPTCWREGWMRREAGHILSVLAAEREARHASGLRSGIVHVSVNPPPELWDRALTLRGFGKLRAKMYRIARKAGLEGGAVVFHRVRCADRWDPIETDGPHFHILGFGWVDGEAYRRTGWVVKNHGLKRTPREVRGEATYLLSHSHRAEGISQEGKSEGVTLTVTWFGRSVRADDIPTEGPFCPLCERSYPLSEWLDLEWVGQGPPPTEPVAVDWSEWRAFTLDRTGHLGFGDRVRVTRSTGIGMRQRVDSDVRNES